MSSRPSGTVTFLFTDVEGSTRLWESDREGMAASLAVHDRILREAIDTGTGYVFATGGDSYSAAFPTATQALGAAAAAQLALESQEWEGPPLRVRMGIHTGAAEERDGDYFGPAVTRAARIMAVGHGGQVLVSSTTAGLLQDRLEPPITLSDLGTHALKDLERHEHLFELRHPDLPVITAPLASGTRGGAHLPEQLTSFIGRTVEVSAVTALLEGSRVVTLTGVGGTGKTRLAIEVARAVAERYPDGVWISELAPVIDQALVLNQIADTWGLRPGEGATLIQVVSAYLGTKELLLLIDNCEHVLDSVTGLVAELFASGPGLAILATSRESLGIPGEAAYRVPSMTLPKNEDEALQSDAVALFLDRFQRARPGYTPTEADLAAVIRVCKRLDGIPLGLELAAARLRSIDPAELADRLDSSFRILTGGTKTALPRQRTLQATIDWSYDLLEPGEQSLFGVASAFSGGFDLAAIEAVGARGHVEDWEVLDLVDRLVDKSLLIARHGQAGTRFHMLEPIRQYAQEKLVDAGEALEVHNDHAGYYSELVSRTAPGLRDSRQTAAHQLLQLELDNIRSALAELRDNDRVPEFLAMCFNLAIFWSQASMQVEGLDVLLPVLEAGPEASPTLLARAWFTAGMLAFQLTDPRSVEYSLRGLEIAESVDDGIATGWLSAMAGMAAFGTTDRTDSADLFDRGERLVLENLDNPWWDRRWDQIFLGFGRGFTTKQPSKEAWENLAATVAEARAVGDLYTAAGVMIGAYSLRDRDDDPAVLAYLREAKQLLGDMGFRHNYGHALIYWGWLTRDQEGEEVGESAITEGSEMLAEIGDLPCALDMSRNLAGHLLDDGRLQSALRQLVFAAHQAQATPDRYAARLAELACRAAVMAGNLPLSARLVGYREAVSASNPPPWFEDCRVTVESGLGTEEVQRLATEGSRLTGSEVLSLVGSWSEGLIGAGLS